MINHIRSPTKIPGSAQIQQKRTTSPKMSRVTKGPNPQNERYEDYPLSIWEEDPSPPNDNEITEKYLHQSMNRYGT